MIASWKTYQKSKSENASIFENVFNSLLLDISDANFPLIEITSENEKISSFSPTCERQPISVKINLKPFS